MQFLQICGDLVSGLRHNRVKGHFEFGMEALVGQEGHDHRCRLRGVVVCELREWEEVDPVVLLIIDVHPKVLFQDLVDTFRLPIGLWVVGRGEVGLDVEQLEK